MRYINTSVTLKHLYIAEYVHCKELGIRDKKIEKLIYKLNKTLFIYEWYYQQIKNHDNKYYQIFNQYWNVLYLKYQLLSINHIEKTKTYILEYYNQSNPKFTNFDDINLKNLKTDVLYIQRYFKLKDFI